MKTALLRKLRLAFVVSISLVTSSCVTPNGNWEPEFPEKGSAKGGASQLMRR